jgi:hypothetical protein
MQGKPCRPAQRFAAVRVDVTVEEVFVSSVVQRVAIGGSHLIVADVNLVDAKSGEILAVKPGSSG